MLNVILLVLLLCSAPLGADPIPVRYTEGSVHGFLSLRALDGKVLASGDLTQVIRGNRAISRLVFRFKDGSIDDETSTFSQHGTFRLLTDHHIQKGPAFTTPTDVLIKTATGQVTARYREKDQDKVDTMHLDLPSDLANGIILDVLKNIPPSAETKLSYVVAAPKPRLVKLSIKPDGEQPFWVAGIRHKALRFDVKVSLGGIEGLIAPLVGKEPPDIYVWIVGGESPAFVKMEGPLYLGGPIWDIEMTSPVWPRSPLAVPAKQEKKSAKRFPSGQ